ncbi:hypothetical protein BGZ65_012653, partial [Modicella reniformis]
MSRNVDALRITEIDVEDQALVLHSQVSPALQRAHPASVCYSEMESDAKHQAQIDQLQQQIDKILQEMQQMKHPIHQLQQQTDQRAQQQQQHQQHMNQALHEIQQTNNHIEE